MVETIFSSRGQPSWTSCCWGRDQHYDIPSTGPGAGTCKLLLLQEEARAVRWVRAIAHSPSFWTRRLALLWTCHLCPWSQPLSDKRLSLARMLTPPWPGQVASSLGSQSSTSKLAPRSRMSPLGGMPGWPQERVSLPDKGRLDRKQAWGTEEASQDFRKGVLSKERMRRGDKE